MFFSEFKKRSSGSESENLVSEFTGSLIKSPIDAASIPLVDYADNLKVGFKNVISIQVFGDDENASLDRVELYDYFRAPLIGEWIYKNCTEDFKRKYLLMDVSDEELKSGKVPNLSRRLIKEDSSKKPSNLLRVFDLLYERDGKIREKKEFSQLFVYKDVIGSTFENNLSKFVSAAADTENPINMISVLWQKACLSLSKIGKEEQVKEKQVKGSN